MKVSLLILTGIGLYSCGQSGKSTPGKVKIGLETADSTKTKKHNILVFIPETFTKTEFKYADTFIDTEFRYTDPKGNDVVIQNSFPKGGGDIDELRGYYDSSGTNYGYGIFWTRIINETSTQLDLSINFPDYSFAISGSSDAYFKLFLPPDTMTNEKRSLYNYGITGLKSFLDTSFNKPTVLQRTINPQEECLFFVGLLVHYLTNEVQYEQELFQKNKIFFTELA